MNRPIQYRWLTRFEDGYMIHDMPNDVHVRTDMGGISTTVYRGGREVSRFDVSEMNVGQYTDLLLRLESDARQLELFNSED